ncbi:hypothetical protein PVL29_007914 [Vitis rotundifolia]|uniref:C2H2-type domain-containing protein n=1 Tax=Vitis rotundifolia TaxID=103349 RepID=A0AA39A1J1_VITRO|nr:hypothetical protein PVL29_007914 [Vitis rotundifolia]
MAESVPCEGEERQGLGSSGLRENRLSLKPINTPMGGSDEGDDGKGRRAVLIEARLECKISSKGLGCSKASREAKCPVCSKSFHSKKAMHGHMRCHPEREWRGINPPPSTKTASCSSVSQEIDGLSHASMTSTVVSSDISPSQPPLQWMKTGRRGQNRIINSYSSSCSSCNISSSQNKGIEEKHQVSERAGLQKRQQLKMLQLGNLRDYPSKKLKIHERGALGFRGQEDAGNKSRASWKDFLKIGFNLGPKEVDTDKKSGDDRIIPGGQLDDQMDVSDNKRFLKTLLPRKYKCGTCNKTFPTYQALTMGNKYASSSHTAASEEEGQALGTSKHAKQLVQKSHKCRTCNKSFPTGQSLGGHQTTHRQKPAQLAAPKQEASQSAGSRVLDFDLNELPPMEKE